MTTYDNTNSYYWVESPLSLPEDEHEWPEYWPQEMGRDPVSEVQQRMLVILFLVVFLIFGFGIWAVRNAESGVNQAAQVSPVAAVDPNQNEEQVVAAAAPAEAAGPAGLIAPLFTPEIQYWAPQIVAWATAHGIDPNMAATVMQIESCGDPNAVSSAGAQGLFQVMPFHFDPGENMQDPDTNARRGMAYLALGMELTGGDTSRTFAGYNGGHGTAAKPWDNWPNETQRYYVWSTGIYKDAAVGSNTSETLNNWLSAGGAGLCRQAAARLGLQ